MFNHVASAIRATVCIDHRLLIWLAFACCTLQVDQVTETDVTCTAKTSAELDGLLTVFHTERSADSLENAQNDLPVLCETDRNCITALSKDFDIDFVSLSFTRTAEDVTQARSFMQKIGQGSCKVGFFLAALDTFVHLHGDAKASVKGTKSVACCA